MAGFSGQQRAAGTFEKRRSHARRRHGDSAFRVANMLFPPVSIRSALRNCALPPALLRARCLLRHLLMRLRRRSAHPPRSVPPSLQRPPSQQPLLRPGVTSSSSNAPSWQRQLFSRSRNGHANHERRSGVSQGHLCSEQWTQRLCHWPVAPAGWPTAAWPHCQWPSVRRLKFSGDGA